MLEILISSSVLIAVLALLRRFLRGRISARLQYALWALVLLRLLVPVTLFESRVSVAAAAQPIAAQVQEYSAQRAQTVYIPVDMGENPQTGEPMEAVGRTFVEPLDVARWVWYAGMAGMALWFLGANLRLRHRLRCRRIPHEAPAPVPVYVAADIPSPCLFGLFRPAIYLTEQAAADPGQARQIIAHESSHRRHGDLFWALLRSLCLVIYWFDPFVWWAAVLSRRDAELACDESTLKTLGQEQRFDYGRTLLALATVKLRPGDLLCGATTMTGGKNSLRERIEGIARTRKFSVSLAAAALAIVALVVGCTFSGADSADSGDSAAPTVTPVPTDSGSNAQIPSISSEELAEALQDPDTLDALASYSAYLTDFTNESPVPWLTWLRFENEEQEQMARDNYTPLIRSTILSVEKINDKLWAFTAEVQTYPDVPAQRIFNFLAVDETERYVIRNVDSIPEELSGNLDPSRYDPQLLLDDGMVALGAPAPEQMAIQATLMEFASPAFVQIQKDSSYVSDGTAQWDMSFEDLLYCTDSWEVNTQPTPPEALSGSRICLFNDQGDFVAVLPEYNGIYLYLNSELYASYHIGDTSGSWYYDSLLAWAEQIEYFSSQPKYLQFLTVALTTDYQQRYTAFTAAERISPPGPENYEAFYASLKPLVTEQCYNTMLLNLEIFQLDKLALERGYRLTPLSFEITAVNQTREITAAGVTDRWQHEFDALLQVTTDEGLIGTATLSGYVLTDPDSDGAQVSGFKLEGGTILNADPAEDLLPTDSPVDELKKFANPDAVVINGSGSISGGSDWPAMNLEELLASSDSWQQTFNPSGANVRSGNSITLSDGNGSFLVIDADCSDILYYPQNQLYAGYQIPGAKGIDYYNALLDWASGFPGPNEAH